MLQTLDTLDELPFLRLGHLAPLTTQRQILVVAVPLTVSFFPVDVFVVLVSRVPG